MQERLVSPFCNIPLAPSPCSFGVLPGMAHRGDQVLSANSSYLSLGRNRAAAHHHLSSTLPIGDNHVCFQSSHLCSEDEQLQENKATLPKPKHLQ